jgi:hypothetical protein
VTFAVILKSISIIASGFFGVLGLVTDFRSKETGKLSAWGKLSLAGVILTSSFALAIQWMDELVSERSRRDDAAETLRIVQNTEGTLSDIKRLLKPLDEPLVSMYFKLPCENEKIRAFCEEVISESKSGGTPSWKHWPLARENGVFTLDLDVYLFRTQKRADEFLGKHDDGLAGAEVFPPEFAAPLSYKFHLNSASNEPPIFVVAGDDGAVEFFFLDHKPAVLTDGSFVSMVDFKNAVMFVNEFGGLNGVEFTPTQFALRSRTGTPVATFAPFSEVTGGTKKLLRYDFGEE